MSAPLDLKSLSKSSAKVATFRVRLFGGRASQYTYTQKRGDQKLVTAHKFEARLVGVKPESYCIGFVKGSADAVAKAKIGFPDGSIWDLSKIVLDPNTQMNFISSPLAFRVDLSKSTLVPVAEEGSDMPQHPVPPRTVAEVARITSNRATDLLAVVKSVDRQRTSKKGEEIVDVQLLDNSTMPDGRLASVTVGVFGAGKIAQLRAYIGSPMVFFNLSVMASSGQTSITHYDGEIVTQAPPCPKTTELESQKEALTSATNTTSITTDWAPSGSKDITGPQVLSALAILECTKDAPETSMPDTLQLMWIHFEEPDPNEEVLDQGRTRIWFRLTAREAGGATTLGVPERVALKLASTDTREDFLAKHAAGQLNLPLLCHARVTRSTRQGTAGATFVNHTLQAVEPVSWAVTSAPNAAFEGILRLLNSGCSQHDNGLLFAFLADIKPDPIYGFSVSYDGTAAPKSTYVVSLIASTTKSATEKVGEEGFKVTTDGVTDPADTAGAAQTGCTVVGFCSLQTLSGFRLDPPRGKPRRCAICFFSRKDEDGCLHIHKLEYVEPDQIENAVACLRKLRKLCQKIKCDATEKRAVSDPDIQTNIGSLTKKARQLQTVPTDASME